MRKKLSLFFILLSFFSQDLFSQIKKPAKHHDDPSAREEYDFIRLRDPATGEIPPMIAQKENEFAAKLPKHYYGGKTNLESAFDWKPMGPINVCGRVQAIGIDIKNEKNMLAGTASGGVWRSIDGGQSWLKVTLPNDEQTISAIVQDTRPGKESTWYYSTGELLSTTGRRETSNVRTHSWGNGIYKSTDDGASWNPLPSTVTTSKNSVPINFTGIWNLALDTKNLSQNILYAACYGGIMRSSDGGATWANVLGNDSAKCFNSEIVIGAGGTVYAAIGSVYDGTASPHQGVWRSIDGMNWTNITGNIFPKTVRRIRLALSQVTDSILYCLTEAPPDWTLPDTTFFTDHTLSKFTYHSKTAGRWEARTVPFDDFTYYNGSLGGYCLTLNVHPNDPDQVFIGGNDLYYSTNGFSDAGTEIGGYVNNSYSPESLHPDVHTFVFSPSNPSTIFVGHDGGISSTDDYTQGLAIWTHYNNGLVSTQIYHSTLDHGTPGSDFIVSGLQDNNIYGTHSADPLTDWDNYGGGDGMTVAIAPGASIIFGSWQYGSIEGFSNDGTTDNFMGYLTYPSTDDTSTFFTNFILEPNAGNELYQAFTARLWRADDITTSVQQASGYMIEPLWTEIEDVFNELNPKNAFITTFGFSTDVPNILFFGTNIGKLYEVDSASTVPVLIDISSALFPKDGFISGIEVDPADTKNIIVTFSNYNVQSLFHTTDKGKTWTAIGGNLEELPDGAGSGPSVRCAKILHTSNGTIYYAGTSVGLYSTTKINGMQTVWTQEGPTTIGSLIVESLDARQSDGKIIVSTQGGGVFTNIPSNAVKSGSTSAELLQVEQNYPNPFAGHSTIRFLLGKQTAVAIELYNALGVKISTIVNSLFNSGMNTIELTAENLSSGKYFLRFSADNSIATKMITIAK